MSKTKAGGSTKNGRDSRGQRLGVKLFGGQQAATGDIIIRQRGNTYDAGENTILARDYTIHAAIPGHVAFRQTRKTMFSGNKKRKTVVSVLPLDQ